MRELFAHDFISDQATEMVPVPPTSIEKWRLQDGDLLFGRRSLTLDGAGKCSLVVSPSRPTVFESSLIRVRLDQGRACPRFFFYLFKSQVGRSLIETIVEQVAVAGIRSSDLARLHVPLPPPQVQRKIADVLGSIDDLIYTNGQIAENCTALWRAVVRDALASATESTALSELADFVNGKNFTKGASGNGRPVIRTPEVRRGPDSGTPRSDVTAADENIAREGDILFVWSGSLTVGRWMWEEGVINQHVFKVLPRPGVPAWLVFSLIEYQMPWFLSLAADKATTMGHIKREHLDTKVPVPSATDIERLSRDHRAAVERSSAVRDRDGRTSSIS
ncbi:restriction endonuclease subunit S [Mycolicibacterium novocastrense]|nr:restriction endonuclease subunit S [Mycolicibacterium novocastrense]